ncbi:hypothetical protein DY052_06195 [Apilactobacillus timberlakei]|uniref:hypothetical protein n=1 Tax=Apilactobacillus timberlakei TaxID=2008380 RepID=UPI0011261757|nr:hypothetical protein [Apilactobacillus timberlakei]TPR15014.1 hypothetical protein DY052_06195 [Apilactobacillus timberlakei]
MDYKEKSVYNFLQRQNDLLRSKNELLEETLNDEGSEKVPEKENIHNLAKQKTIYYINWVIYLTLIIGAMSAIINYKLTSYGNLFSDAGVSLIAKLVCLLFIFFLNCYYDYSEKTHIENMDFKVLLFSKSCRLLGAMIILSNC